MPGPATTRRLSPRSRTRLGQLFAIAATIAAAEAARQTILGPAPWNRNGGLWFIAALLTLAALLALRTRAWQQGRFIAVALLALFLGNTRRLGSTDTVPNSFVPFALLRHGTLTLDPYPSAEHAEGREQPCVRRYGEHRLACAGIGVSLLALPLFLPAALAGRDPPSDDHRILLDKLSAATLTTLALWLLWHVFAALTGGHLAVLAVVAAGSSLLTIAAQTLWQFTGVVLGLSLALYGVFAHRRGRTERDAFAAVLVGAGCAVAVLSRQLSAIVVPWLVLELLRRSGGTRRAGRHLFFVGVSALPFALGLFAYNAAYFGGPMSTGYGTLDALFELSPERFFGYLLSPARGLLVYCPLVAVALYGLCKHAWPLAAAVLTHLLLLGSWTYWDGAYSPGPRLWTDIAPLIAVGIALSWDAVARRRWFQLLCGYSVAMHLMLAYVPATPRARALHLNLEQGPWTPASYAPASYFDRRPYAPTRDRN